MGAGVPPILGLLPGFLLQKESSDLAGILSAQHGTHGLLSETHGADGDL